MFSMVRPRYAVQGLLGYLREGRNIGHVVTLGVMTGIACVVLFSGGTFYTSISYNWFFAHWPYTERGWGLLFAAFSLLGSLTFFTKNRYVHLASATAMGVGHLLIAQGMWISNHLSTAPITYSFVAFLSIWVFWRVIEEEG